MSHKQLILNALAHHKGEDAYRARSAFSRCTPQQMQEQHGSSGMTRQQVLDLYEAHEAACTAAMAWVRANVP